jgi:lysophospholipase L1-like esterase
MSSILPLTWNDKKNSPLLADFIAKYGAEYCMTAEEINQLRDAVNEMGEIQQSVFLGAAEPASTPAGTGNAYWEVITPGTYTLYGGVVLQTNKRGLISRSAAGVFSISQIPFIALDSKINLWTAKAYAIGDQVNYSGKDWTANAITVAGDVPATSVKWTERLTAYLSASNRVTFPNSIQLGVLAADGTISSSTSRSIITFNTSNISSEYFFTALSPNTGAFLIFYDSSNAFIKSLALTTSFQYTNQKISELTSLPVNTFKIAIGYVNTAPVPVLIGDVFLDKNYRAKIQTWVAKAYFSGDQVYYLGKDWIANTPTVAVDIPETSPKWTERLTAYLSASNRVTFTSSTQLGILSSDGTIGSSAARSIVTFNTNNSSSEYFFTALSPNSGAFIIFYDSSNAFIKSLALTTSFQYTNKKISELTSVPINTFKIAIGYINTDPVPVLIGDVFLDKTYKAKIQTWVAGVYVSGEQVYYLGKDWIANASTVAGDIPQTSPKWTERLTAYVSADNKTLFTNSLIEAGAFDINGNKTSSSARTRIIFTITNKSGEYLLNLFTLPNSAFLILYDSSDVFIKSVTLSNSFQYVNQKLSELTSIPDNLGKIGLGYLNGGFIPTITGSVFSTSLDLLAVKNSISAIQVFKSKYTKAFTDYFTTQKTDWINTTGWTFDTVNKQLIPTLNGGFTSNYISLNRQILTDTRLFKTIALVSPTTIMNIMLKGGNGESMYTVNCSASKLQIYGITGNNTLGAVIKEVTIPFAITAETKVIIDVAKSDYNYIFMITNYNTLQSVSVTLSGWTGGRQHGLYSYSLTSGTPFKILSSVVLLPTDIDILIVGDSITEGFGIEDSDANFAKKYGSLVGDYIGDSAISAMAGDTASGIMRFENEYNFIKPKYIALCIGTNGGGLSTIISSFISKALAINAIPIINYVPIIANSTNATIDGIDADLRGARFDIATALNNTIADGKNNALFVDGIHPNVSGHLVMFNRFINDLTLITK